MNYEFTTPLLIFPAISLLMLAYTNRFLTLSSLVRELHSRTKSEKLDRDLKQIDNLRKRLKIIRMMQILGAVAFIVSVFAMLIFIIDRNLSLIIFICSLVSLICSLALLIYELQISVNAIHIQLDDIN